MADKLSERLERIARGQVWGFGDLKALEAAIDLARRVEGAQVGRVDMVCASDAVVVDELDRPVSINKKRVRLVPEDGQGGGDYWGAKPQGGEADWTGYDG